MIPKKQILTVSPLELAPILQRILNGRESRMEYQLKRNA